VNRGDTVGPYQIVQRLGGQHLAEVYSATRGGSGSPGSAGVAIKIPKLEGGSEALEVFKMKVEIARLASHPSLIRLIDVGEVGPLPFMVLELLDGVHLSALLARGARIHAGIAAAIGRSLAEALHHLHALHDHQGRPLQVVHLEVNSNNVVLTRDGGVKLIDYGAIGERLQSTRPVGPSYDIHSLGLLLGEMVQDGADQYFYKIIARSTATRQEDRFASAREMADALSVHLLTHPGFRPELAIRQMMSTLEARPLADISLGGPDPFASSTDTRVRTLDLGPAPQPSLASRFFWIGFAVMMLLVVSFLVYRLWPW
jgi:serine/threonine protein kinase